MKLSALDSIVYFSGMFLRMFVFITTDYTPPK